LYFEGLLVQAADVQDAAGSVVPGRSHASGAIRAVDEAQEEQRTSLRPSAPPVEVAGEVMRVRVSIPAGAPPGTSHLDLAAAVAAVHDSAAEAQTPVPEAGVNYDDVELAAARRTTGRSQLMVSRVPSLPPLSVRRSDSGKVEVPRADSVRVEPPAVGKAAALTDGLESASKQEQAELTEEITFDHPVRRSADDGFGVGERASSRPRATPMVPRTNTPVVQRERISGGTSPGLGNGLSAGLDPGDVGLAEKAPETPRVVHLAHELKEARKSTSTVPSSSILVAGAPQQGSAKPSAPATQHSVQAHTRSVEPNPRGVEPAGEGSREPAARDRSIGGGTILGIGTPSMMPSVNTRAEAPPPLDWETSPRNAERLAEARPVGGSVSPWGETVKPQAWSRPPDVLPMPSQHTTLRPGPADYARPEVRAPLSRLELPEPLVNREGPPPKPVASAPSKRIEAEPGPSADTAREQGAARREQEERDQQRAEEQRAEEQRAEEQRAEEQRAEEQRAEQARRDEERAAALRAEGEQKARERAQKAKAVEAEAQRQRDAERQREEAVRNARAAESQPAPESQRALDSRPPESRPPQSQRIPESQRLSPRPVPVSMRPSGSPATPEALRAAARRKRLQTWVARIVGLALTLCIYGIAVTFFFKSDPPTEPVAVPTVPLAPIPTPRPSAQLPSAPPATPQLPPPPAPGTAAEGAAAVPSATAPAAATNSAAADSTGSKPPAAPEKTNPKEPSPSRPPASPKPPAIKPPPTPKPPAAPKPPAPLAPKTPGTKSKPPTATF
jgi:hypothetical protein